jgi:hypothetical protein
MKLRGGASEKRFQMTSDGFKLFIREMKMCQKRGAPFANLQLAVLRIMALHPLQNLESWKLLRTLISRSEKPTSPA